MKRLFIFFFLPLFAIVSCNQAVIDEPDQEIVLNCDGDFSALVETKASAITSVPSTLYWGATTGTSTESTKWSATSASVSSSKINTGKYQTKPKTAYNYYVANQTFTVGATTTMTVANNDTDIIVGRIAANSTVTPSVTLNHIFARTGTVVCNTQSGYSISNVSFTLVGRGEINGTAGTYNMTSGSWTSASTKLTSAQSLTSSSDLYLIPGEYTLTCNYTLSKGNSGEYSESFSKTAYITLVGGCINNITCTAIGGGAEEIVITVSLAAWGTHSITPSFVN